MSGLSDEVREVFELHQYAYGSEGIVCDGEWAHLACTCGWRENYEMPEDDIRLAERRWEAHLADALAPLVARAAPAVLLDGSVDETTGANGEAAEEPTDPEVRDFAAFAYLVVTCEALGLEVDEEWDRFMFARAIHRRIRAALTQDEQP